MQTEFREPWELATLPQTCTVLPWDTLDRGEGTRTGSSTMFLQGGPCYSPAEGLLSCLFVCLFVWELVFIFVALDQVKTLGEEFIC